MIEADGHQRHLKDELQAGLQAPVEDLVVAGRQQEAGSAEFRRRADQGHQALVRLRDAVGEEGDPGRVAGDAPEMFDDRCGLLIDRVAQFGSAIETMDLVADAVAGGHVGRRRGPDLVARELQPERLALEDRHGLAGAEAELGVKAERAIVEAGLQQAHARGLPPRQRDRWHPASVARRLRGSALSDRR